MNNTRASWALLAVAAALRFGYVLAYPQLPLCGDCVLYDEVGRNVASGKGFVGGRAAETYDTSATPDPSTPEIGMGPVYPAFLGLIYRLVGHRVDTVRAAQAALSTLLLIPIFTIARWAFGRVTALISTAVAAVYPPFIFYSAMMLTETLSIVFLVIAVWAVLWAWRTNGAGRWVLAGAASGLLILIRSEVAPLIIVVPALAWWRNPGRRTAAMLAMYTAVIAVTMAPWVVRNYRLFQRFIPVSAHDGDTLYISVRGWSEWRYDDPEFRTLVRGRTYLEQEDAFHDAAVREILNHPTRVFWRRLMRFPDLWLSSHTNYVAGLSEGWSVYRARRAVVPLLVKVSLLALNTVLIAAGLLGMAHAMTRPDQRTPEVLLLAAPIACIAAVHLPLFAAPRYQIPMMPFLLVFAGWFCRDLFPAAPE